MPIVVPAVSATALLDLLLDSLETWVHLYESDTDLGPSTTLDDLVEASWYGYEPQKATGWTPAEWFVDRAQSASDPLRWTYGLDVASREVFGYYVTDGKDGDLLWAESRPEGPVVLSVPTDSVDVFPRLTLREDPEPE